MTQLDFRQNDMGGFTQGLKRIVPGVLLHRGMLSLIDQAVVSATSFLTGILVARSCSKEEMGLYWIAFGLVTVLTNVQIALISSPYTVYSPRLTGDAHRRYLGSATLHQAALSMLLMAGLAASALVSSLIGKQAGLAPTFWVLVATAGFLLYREHVRRVYFASLRVWAALFFDLGISVMQLSAVGILAYFHLLSTVTAYVAMGTVCAVAAVIWLWINRSEIAIRGSVPLADFWRNWAQAKWVLAGSVVFSVTAQLPVWFLTGLKGPAATATFGAAMSVVCLSNPFVMGIGNYLSPKTSQAFAHGGTRQVASVMAKSTAFLGGIMLLFFLVMLLFGDAIVVLMYGAKYAGNGATVSVLALAFLAWAGTIAIGYGLLALERSDVNFTANCIGLGLALASGFWLVGAFGPVGGAWMYLLGHLGASVARSIGFGKVIRSASELAVST
jgi:O-antigen/teichoic acid export membrane protein